MIQKTPMRAAVYVTLLICGASAGSNWDYRFHGNTSPINNEASSRTHNEVSSSNKTLYSEGGQVILQDSKNWTSTQSDTTMTTSRTSSAQANMPVISEGGGSDQVYVEDNHSRNPHSEENGVGVVTNSTFYVGDDSVKRRHEDSTALQTLNSMEQSGSQAPSKEAHSRASDTHQPSTALAAVGRSLDEHHPESSGQRSDAISSYYDFLVNEGSYKFWSVFQVFTAALLIYSAFAAAYYAKYTFATMDYPDYPEDGFFFKRSGADRAQGEYMYYDYEDDDVTTTPRPQQSTFLGMSSATFQRIMDALSSKKYS